MFRVVNNEIELIRGDSAVINFTLLDETGEPIDLRTFDGELVFTVKVGHYAKQATIEKEIVNGVIVIDPYDTENLAYAKYLYDVCLRMPNGYTDTVIPAQPFRVVRDINSFSCGCRGQASPCGLAPNGLVGRISTGFVKGDPGLSAYEIACLHGFRGTETEWLASLQGQTGADGKSAYDIALDEGYVGTVEEWMLSLRGADGQDGADGKDGADGADGKDGASAYDVAVEYGYEGTVAEWLEDLKGDPGADGKSAYEVAVEEGFEGTIEEWLDSLKGEPVTADESDIDALFA